MSQPPTPFSEIRRQIGQAMLADQFRLRRSLDSVQRAAKGKQQFDRSLKRLTDSLAKSIENRAKRLANLPVVELNAELPVSARRDEIVLAIEKNQVVILCGETGSGKSTQLPLICLGMGRGVSGMIGHTQPRRIAARSVAARVVEEVGSSIGDAVGFKIRFTDTTSPKTYVKLMTDGILLAESQGDRFFEQYDTIIIDEAHERSLNIDFLLGRLKQILPRRPDLKVIITSATIDAKRFADHFGKGDQPAPVIEVSGRTYPVEMRYRPPFDPDLKDAEQPDKRGGSQSNRRRSEADMQAAVLDAVDELMIEGPGDILIFMPTERDIHETAKSLRGRLLGRISKGQKTDILPLYARLSTKEQSRIFQTQPHRRIVIATNVAESSLTVPGIHYVIDSGTARISRYSARSRMQRLPVEPISQASANQRAGRCGRIGPGICIRLYSEDDYKGRDAYTAPEIQRTNLASVILQTTALRMGPLEDFPFLEPPRTGTITDGYRSLYELGAIDEQNQITEVGRQLSRLPVDPRVGRLILAGHEENCLHEVLVIAAALELQDPRDRPIDKQQAADEAHAKFQDAKSDFLSYLKLWDFYHKVRSGASRGQLRKACQQNFLSYNRMREWVDIHHQLSELVAEVGLKPVKRQDNFDAIHRALLTGFLASIALLTDQREYTAAGNQKVTIWPGSGLFKEKPKWIVAAELVETTKRYVRTVARIQPEWIEPIAGHLMKRTYSDPEWDSQAGSAMAYEKVTLFGIPVVPRRRTRYAKVDPELSREMMIREGLVAGHLELQLPFLRHNARLMEELEGLQTRTRRFDLVVDDEERFEFYDKRIPREVADIDHLKRWLRKAEKSRRGLLNMEKVDLRRTGTEEVTGQEFPDAVKVGQIQLPIEYHLEPGSPEDGVTLELPQEAFNQIDQNRLGWLVPGLVEEKVAALVKSLPKSLRRQFVPTADTAKEVASKLNFGQGNFEQTVARLLSEIARESVAAADFQEERLPNHLRMNVRIVNGEGESLATGRDLKIIRQQIGGQASSSFSKIDDDRWQRDGLTTWDFGELPAQVTVYRGSISLKGYPTLIDDGETVALRLRDLPARSALETRAGIRRLTAIALARFVKVQVENIPRLQEWVMLSAAMGGAVAFQKNLGDLIVDRALFPEKGPYPRTEVEFQERVKKAKSLIPVATQDVVILVSAIMSGYATLRKSINATQSPHWKYAADDVKKQIAALTQPGFLTAAAWGWLRQYPRYFEAATVRLQKLPKSGAAKDSRAQQVIEDLVGLYQYRAEEHRERDIYDPELEYYRWMLEEYRVSLFAQELRTAIPVSEVRLEKQWAKVSD
ncbi:MAG: ATP-dependent RNA helicase HrpA [Rhodopirellula sp.]|nr:ATP-dependent RNA helicase HrpA [Rhodopirellula sp.]